MKKNKGLNAGRISFKSPGKIVLKMKLTSLFILLGIIQSVALNSYSQTTKLSMELRDVSVVDALRTIEDQSEFYFVYNKEAIDLDRKISLNAKNLRIDEILDRLFEDTNVRYQVLERHVILSTLQANQSNITVTGKVTDATGAPLPGVTVVVKGNMQGTITDGEGNYLLSNVATGTTLVFSFVGMEAQEVIVGNQSTINIVMQEETIGLEEVVAIGYGTMRKSDLTGAVVRADQEIINERPNVSVMQSLRGALPGLNIGQTNEAGAEPDISIRGQTSISGESAPLIVVDNIIFRGNLIDINPNDIETIDILKDASSAAIYGSQAANGVIIITTTKKGEKLGKPVINFSSSYSFDSPAKELVLESPEEFIQRMKDADLYNSRTEESGYLEPNPDYDVTTRFRANPQIDAYHAGITTDWYNTLVNENMHTQNHNLSLSNQTQNSGYYISLGYTEQVGYMHNEGYSRWNARINADNAITDWFDVGVQTFMTRSDYSGQSLPPSNIYSFHWYAPAYTPDGELEENPDGLNINPLYVFDVDDLDKRLNFFGNIYANIQIPFIKGLSFKTNYSSNYRIQYFVKNVDNYLKMSKISV